MKGILSCFTLLEPISKLIFHLYVVRLYYAVPIRPKHSFPNCKPAYRPNPVFVLAHLVEHRPPIKSKGLIVRWVLPSFLWITLQAAGTELDILDAKSGQCDFDRYLNGSIDLIENASSCLQAFSPALYNLQDFSLDKSYQYLEFRVASNKFEVNYILVLAVFDDLGLTALSSDQKAAVINTHSLVGFRHKSGPIDTAIYGVAVCDDNIQTITSIIQLMSLFYQVDTEAEVYWWLWAHSYEAFAYQKVRDGYIVFANLSNARSKNDKQKKLFVDGNGVITDLDLLVSERKVPHH